MKLSLFSLLLLVPFSLNGAISDLQIHQKNQVIAAEVAATFLEKGIFENIDVLAKELFRREFDVSIYSYDEDMNFVNFPIWEGKDKTGITLLIYVWPPEKIALKQHPEKDFYQTTIHAHPICCAFTPLQGSITQISYENVGPKAAKPCLFERFTRGDAVFDDNSSLFIHRLVCKDEGGRPAITLHAYGAPTSDAVRHIFQETLERCSYSEISH